MAARIDLELHAIGVAEVRHMVDDVAADRIGRHQVGIAVHHQQAERGIERQELADVLGDAGRRAAGAVLPFPFAVHLAVENRVGHVGLEPEMTYAVLNGEVNGKWEWEQDRKSTRLNSSHLGISYAVFCLK